MIFDSAGTIKHDVFIEQDDVPYGATPSVLEFYTRAHARKTHHDTTSIDIPELTRTV